MSFAARFLAALAASASLAACVDPPASSARKRDGEARAGAADSDPAESTKPAPPELVAAPAGEVVEVVRAAIAQARAEERTLVVYVGATWCEPCEAFHRAVERGELDAELAGVRFLEFDADRDRQRLEQAGYSGRLIPRFVVPADSGAPSSVAVEGGIKGDGAVDHIMKRLGPALAASPAMRP